MNWERPLEPPDCWPRIRGIGSCGVPSLYEDSEDYNTRSQHERNNSEEDDEYDE